MAAMELLKLHAQVGAVASNGNPLPNQGLPARRLAPTIRHTRPPGGTRAAIVPRACRKRANLLTAPNTHKFFKRVSPDPTEARPDIFDSLP